MKRTRIVVLATVSAITLGQSAALAQGQQQDERWPQQQDREANQHQDDEQNQQVQMLMMHHADSDIIDATVTNLQQEELGNISALVIDLQSEKVAYAIVSFGGVLGIGDELHAVPWSAFTFRPLHDGLILDVSQTQLERQEGFTREQLPDFSDRQWGQRVHEQYGAQPYWSQQDDRWRDQQQQPMTDSDEPTYPGMEGAQFITTYEFLGMNIENMREETIGSIRDFAMNLKDGSIAHVVVGYGGWLGIGETHTALPLQAFQPRNFGTDEPVMALDITQEQLRGAREYDPNRWPQRGAANWAQDIGSQQSTP